MSANRNVIYQFVARNRNYCTVDKSRCAYDVQLTQQLKCELKVTVAAAVVARRVVLHAIIHFFFTIECQFHIATIGTNIQNLRAQHISTEYFLYVFFVSICIPCW